MLRIPRPAAREDRLALLALAAALVIGAFLRFWGLAGQSIYLDEAFALDAARMPVDAMARYLAFHDAHPPLFYLFAHAAVAVLRWPPTWYRYLTAPFGLLTILAAWGFARREIGARAAAVTALIVATEPTIVLFDRFFRMYAIATALGALSFWLMAAALGSEGRRRTSLWIAYAVVATVLPSVLYLGGAVVICQGMYALFDARRRWPALAACALAPLALAPWWWAMRTQWPLAGFAGGRSGVPGWHIARDVLGYAFPFEWYRHDSFDPIFTIVVVAVIAGGLWVSRSGLLAAYLGPVVLQGIAALAAGRNLIYGRYLIEIVPGIAAAAGGLASALSRSAARIGGFVLVSAVLAVNAVADTDLLLDKFYQTSDWNTVERTIAAVERRDDAIVFDQAYGELAIRATPALAGHLIVGVQTTDAIPSVLSWADRNAARRIWYVENQRFYSDPDGDVKRHLDATRPRLREWLEPRADLGNVVYFALYGPAKSGAR